MSISRTMFKTNKEMKKLCLSLFLVVTLVSCTDATQAKLGGYGDRFAVEMINCDGTTGRRWISTGKVLSEEGSDGYYFLQEGTGTLIEVSGNVIITKLKKSQTIIEVDSWQNSPNY